MRRLLRILRWFTFLSLAGLILGAGALTAGYLWLAPTLPSVDALRTVDYQVPMRVYTADDKLIAEYGERRRIRVTLDDVPKPMVQAFIAAEDERFYDHPGVDYQGILRAVWHLIRTGEKGPGGSTITMQVARNFFLSRDATYRRKAREILLALKIERELSKEQILELYFNKIYLGQRAYGVGAAARAYYGRDIGELELAQMAMIAGLPKAPSSMNPLNNPGRALERRTYVLSRMREEGYISDTAFERSNNAPLTAKRQHARGDVEAPYVAERARQAMVARYGKEEAYTRGLDVYTSVDSESQTKAIAALRENLHDYDERHGWRGGVTNLDLDSIDSDAALRRELGGYPSPGPLRNAVVREVDDEGATLLLVNEADEVRLPFEAMAWARPFETRNRRGAEPKGPGDVVSVGDVIRVRETDAGLRLAQIPEPQSALVSLDPRDGRIRALVGGYAFSQSKFNRATQAERQPGSSFKPFVYSAGLENGLTPASLINDAPVVFEDRALEATWRPENYSGRFFGPTRLREALIHSRNLVSIRVLRQVGVAAARSHIQRFGFPAASLPDDLSLALGSGAVSPMQLARGYTVFANGGFLTDPWLVERVIGGQGQVLHKAEPPRACPGMTCDDADDESASQDAGGDGAVTRAASTGDSPRAERVIPATNAWLMTSMMRDVIQEGTGRRAREIGRTDIAGKTGTTNAQKDAWFAGFNHAVATAVWVGFDDVEPMGRQETGSTAALPLWKAFMAHELEGIEEKTFPQPAGMVTVRIDSETGKVTGADDPQAIFEHFREGNVPERESQAASQQNQRGSSDDGDGEDAVGEGRIF